MESPANPIERYYEETRREMEQAKLVEPREMLERPEGERAPTRSLAERLRRSPGVAIIAEHKRQSPSEGVIRAEWSVAWTAEQYEAGGATAISVLTQKKSFGGDLNHLAMARRKVDIPLLGKGFYSTEYDLLQVHDKGADAVLLIVAGLEDDAQLRELRTIAAELGLDTLVEIHDLSELDRAMAIEPDILGINNRNLNTLKVDTGTVSQIIKWVPPQVPVIAESGYKDSEEMRELRDLGVDGVLIGTAFMRAEDPRAAVARWVEAGQPVAE